MNKFGKITCYILAGAFLITLGYFAEKIFNGTLGNSISEERNNALNPNNTVSAADQGTGNLLALIKNATNEMYAPSFETCEELKEGRYIQTRTVEKQTTIKMPSIMNYYVDDETGDNVEEKVISYPQYYERVGEYEDDTVGITYMDTEEYLSTNEYVEGYTLVSEYYWNPLDAIFVYSNGENYIVLTAYLHEHSSEFLSSDWNYLGIATVELARTYGISLEVDLNNPANTITVPTLGLN